MTKQKPRERSEKTLSRVAREQGLDQERLRRWVSFLALCGALDRAIEAGILSGYYLKAASLWNYVSPNTPAQPKIWIWEWKAPGPIGSDL